MRGPAAAFILSGFELLAGTFLVMVSMMFAFRSINRGHYRATTWVIAPLVLAMTFLLPRGARPLGIAAAGLMITFLAAVYVQRPLLEWITGVAASLAAGLVAVSLASDSGCGGGCTGELVAALIGMTFLGAVTHGMILGHWYLNQPRLPIEPLKSATLLMFAAIALELAVGLLTRPELLTARIPGVILMASTSGYWWTWLGLMVFVAVLTLMIRSTVWIRSTQSATGLLYLAMLPAIGAQFVLNLLVTS